MNASAISAEQVRGLTRILAQVARQAETDTILVTDNGGNILAQVGEAYGETIVTIAALAAGSYAATNELARLIGEAGFQSIMQRGSERGVLIQALDRWHLVLAVLGRKSTQGLTKLCIEKACPEIMNILGESRGQSTRAAGQTEAFAFRDAAATVFPGGAARGG